MILTGGVSRLGAKPLGVEYRELCPGKGYSKTLEGIVGTTISIHVPSYYTVYTHRMSVCPPILSLVSHIIIMYRRINKEVHFILLCFLIFSVICVPIGYEHSAKALTGEGGHY